MKKNRRTFLVFRMKSIQVIEEQKNDAGEYYVNRACEEFLECRNWDIETEQK